ncbi:hypothetical protein ES332_A06G132000v1 [Gossypium tomentosum]|uniref:Histone-lysine N-methyltransferase ASHH1 n=1 Tax=Gossypium tomentosum TaxID=34277 RepID=A0A5D2Q6Q2_GOSTO|nr:hypothetical protein ES332_A06G132000v1 [Gossypium tomentosum]
MDPENEDLPQYEHIFQNEFSYRKHKKQKEEDIAICECKFDFSDPDSTCGERCLNVLTSTECTPGYCPCGVYCKNQAGQFIVEYCGEVISWKEAKRRSQAYENQGLKDAFIISLNGSESIDATKKGNLARFINHSCQPNCDTRKWTVLGEIRVGIFAKEDIPIGTELAYDYNFEWYGGAKVRCLCGALNCSGFLGAKSRGFLEDTYLWEDDDERYSVEKIPLYDSAEDEPATKHLKAVNLNSENDVNTKSEQSITMDVSLKSKHQLESTIDTVPMEGVDVNTLKIESAKDINLYSQDAQQAFSQKNAMISRIRSNSACRNYHIRSGPMLKKKSQHYSNGKLKHLSKKQIDLKHLAKLLASKEAQEEVFRYEEMKNEAASQLASLYNEIRPAIEEHERDNQDSVSTSVAEKWIEASCSKLKIEFDFHSSILRNIVCTPQKACEQVKPCEPEGHGGNNDNEVKLEF